MIHPGSKPKALTHSLWRSADEAPAAPLINADQPVAVSGYLDRDSVRDFLAWNAFDVAATARNRAALLNRSAR